MVIPQFNLGSQRGSRLIMKNYTHITLLIDSSGSMECIRDATITNYNKFINDQKKVEGKCTISHYEFSSGSKLQYKTSKPTRHMVSYLPAKYKYDPRRVAQQTLWNANNGAIPLTFGQNLPPLNVGVAHYPYTNEYVTTNEFSCVENFVDIEKAQILNREIYVPSQMTPLLDSIGRAIFDTGEVLSTMPPALRPEKVLFVIITDGAENASVEYSKEDIKAVIEHQTSKYGWDFIFLGANIDAVATGQSYGIARGMSVNFASSEASVYGSTSTLSAKVSNYRSFADVGLAKASLNYSDQDRAVSMGITPPVTNQGNSSPTIASA